MVAVILNQGCSEYFDSLILWAFQSLCRTTFGEPSLATDVTDKSIVAQLITLASETSLMSAPPL